MFHEPQRRISSWPEVTAAERTRLAEELRDRSDRLAVVERECAARLDVIERLEGLRADAVARLEEQDADLVAEAARSAGLELDLQTRRREIERLAAEVEGRTAEIEGLTAEVEGLTAEVEGLSAEIEKLRAALGVASDRADELERRVRALDGELRAMRASWSWRLTAPLRFLARGRRPGGRSGEPLS
jgi:chromosome segregation ATPase